MTIRIVIVDDEPITRMDLEMMLTSNGFDVVGQAGNGFDAIEVCKQVLPDIVLMDIRMPTVDGLKASEVIKREKYAKEIIILSAFSEKDYVDAAMDNSIYAYVVKPVIEKNLIPLIQLANNRSSELDSLNTKVEQLEDEIRTRRVVEKAKGYIMKEKNMDEKEAYNHIRSLSMNKRCTMSEIADAIIKLYE